MSVQVINVERYLNDTGLVDEDYKVKRSDYTPEKCTKCGNRDGVCQCILCTPKIT